MALTTDFWRAVETIHQAVYVGPAGPERYASVGLERFWEGYVASRAAALGRPAPEVVIALFHGFAPRRIHRILPAAWDRAAPEAVLQARGAIARDTLDDALGDDPAVAEAAHELAAMTRGVDWAGKPLAAAHAALPAPESPTEALWLAATVWREYRGDCHVSVLTAAGLGGAAANRLAVATGLVPAEQQRSRGWDDEAWELAARDLRQRGWLDEQGQATDAGRAARAQIESATDRICTAGLDIEAMARGARVTTTVTGLAARSPAMPALNATGVRPTGR